MAVGKIMEFFAAAAKSGALEKGGELLKSSGTLEAMKGSDSEALTKLFAAAQKSGAQNSNSQQQTKMNPELPGADAANTSAYPGMANVTKMYTPIRPLKRQR